MLGKTLRQRASEPGCFRVLPLRKNGHQAIDLLRTGRLKSGWLASIGFAIAHACLMLREILIQSDSIIAIAAALHASPDEPTRLLRLWLAKTIHFVPQGLHSVVVASRRRSNLRSPRYARDDGGVDHHAAVIARQKAVAAAMTAAARPGLWHRRRCRSSVKSRNLVDRRYQILRRVHIPESWSTLFRFLESSGSRWAYEPTTHSPAGMNSGHARLDASACSPGATLALYFAFCSMPLSCHGHFLSMAIPGRGCGAQTT